MPKEKLSLGQALKAFTSGAAYAGFRPPTLNELHRPFRVGNDVTEANAALRTEEVTSGEVGVEWRSGYTKSAPPPPRPPRVGPPADDELVDFVRHWGEKSEIPNCRLLGWVADPRDGLEG